jgi:hypothetical protein
MLSHADIMCYNIKTSNKFLETAEKLEYIEVTVTIKIIFTTNKLNSGNICCHTCEFIIFCPPASYLKHED